MKRQKGTVLSFADRYLWKMFPVCIGILWMTGCSFKSLALRSVVDILGEGADVFYEESDAQFAKESMADQLKLLEILLRNDPSNRDLLLLTSQGFGGYAFLFLEGETDQRAKNFYKRGRDFGLKYLSKKISLDLLNEPDLRRLRQALKKLKKKEVPLLFWTAYCWGGLANLSRDNPRLVASLPKVELMMLKVNEMIPGYFYSGPDLFLGAYYGSRPKMFGGDLGKAQFYFGRALKVSDEKFLMGLVLYAKHYAVPAQDKVFFEDLLQKVLAYPLDGFPEQRLSNTIAKERAKKLLEEIDEKF